MKDSKMITFKKPSRDRGIEELRAYIEDGKVYIVARDLIRELGYTGNWSYEAIEKRVGEGNVIRFRGIYTKSQIAVTLDGAFKIIEAKRKRYKKMGNATEEEKARTDFVEFYLQHEIMKHPYIAKLIAKKVDEDDKSLKELTENMTVENANTDINLTKEKEEQCEVRIDIAYKIFFVMLAMQIILAAAGAYVLFFD